MNQRTTYIVAFVFMATLSHHVRLFAAPQENLEEARQKKAAAIKTFFDTDADPDERIKAVKDIGYPDKETFTRLLKVGQDAAEDDDVRWEALRRYPWGSNYIATVLSILDDDKNGGESLNANLVQDLSRRTVSVLRTEDRQAIQGGYRKLLEDPRESVRSNAYFALVSTQDYVAISKLVDGLQKSEPPVPIASAIRMLDVAGGTRHFNTLRPYLQHEDPLVQAEAARVLAADANSRPAIAILISDQATPESVRVAAFRGMSRFDDQLSSYAIEMIRNPEVPVAVREAAMQAMVGQVNYQKLDDAVQVNFAEAIEAFTTDSNIENIDNGKPMTQAKTLLQKLQKSSPAIRKHYQSRLKQ